MSGLLPLVVALLLGALALEGRGASPLSAPGIGALLVSWYALGRFLAGHLAGPLLREEGDPGVHFERFRRGLGFYRLLVLPAFAVLLWPGGWATLAAATRPAAGDVPALVLAMAPWLVLVLLSRAATFPAERALGLQPLAFRASLVQATRMGMLVVAPLLLLGAGAAAVGALVATDREPFRTAADLAARYDFVSGGLLLAGLAAVLAVFPVIAMRILGARPMEDGPLRRRLEAYARRVGLRYRDLYVWRTGGTLPNAAVLGVGARLRCVVFTDALLDRLGEEEVEAVFAHEAGHALHHHLPLFFFFTVGYMLALFAASRWVSPATTALIEESPLLAAAGALGGMVLYFGLLFGFVSRRLEQQADVHGLLTVGLPGGEAPSAVLADPARHPHLRAVAAGEAEAGDHPFVRSLDGIAEAVGGVREITGWRHFSIADRVEFLRRFCREPAVRASYRGRLRALQGVLGGMLLLFAAAAATDLPVQVRGPDPAAALDRARSALLRGDPAEARRWLEAGVRGGEARGLVLSPAIEPLPPGRPALPLGVLYLAQAAEGGPFAAVERLRLRECEALLRLLLGRSGEAVAVAERAVESVPGEGGAAPVAREFLAALRAESLLVLAHCLEADGRPAAAAAARAAAAEEASLAGSAELLRAARAGP